MPLFVDNDKSPARGSLEEFTSLEELGENLRTFCGFAISRGSLNYADKEERNPYTEFSFYHHETKCDCPAEAVGKEKTQNLTINFFDSELEYFVQSLLRYYAAEFVLAD